MNNYAQKSNLLIEPEKMSQAGLTEHIREYIENEMDKRKIVGLSVAVVNSEGVILSDGFGYADKENNIQADNTTIFPIASITKTFTGIAVMQLVEQGLIDLDIPIGSYIDELSLPGGEENIITVRQLLTHHSGIHGDILYNWYLPEVSEDQLVYEQVVDLINETGTIFTPGKLHAYSNAGYSLLGVLIHRVSGQPYVDYIHSHIISPLGMDNTIAFAGENTTLQIARGYDAKNSMEMPMKLGIPAGGVALTSDDAVKYIQAVIDSYHGEGILLKQETMRQMMTQQNSNVPIDKGFSIGFTWFLQNPISSYTKYASHRGELPPYHAMLVILPELKAGVFISINTNKAVDAPDEMAHKIAGYLYEYHTGKTISVTKPEAVKKMDTEQAKLNEGIYPNVYFGPMKVKAKKNKLLLKSGAMPMPLYLIPCTDSGYIVKVKLFGFIPLPVKELEALKIEFRETEGDKFMSFIIQNSILNPNIRIEPYKIPHEYMNYKGKYKVVNMDNSDRVVKNVQIKKSKEFYLLKYTFLGRHNFNMTIRPVDNENARLAGLGYFQGDKIHWEVKGEKVLMYWSGLVLEKE